LAAVLIAFASVTSGLVTLATHVINHLGYAGVGLMVLVSGVIAVPGTEAPMLFAGFNVHDGKMTLLGIILAGVIGDVIGVAIAYWIGRIGGHELVERHGAKVHVSTADLDRAHRWFDRWGSPVMFVGRFTPLIRIVFSYAAGVARMPFGRCITFSALGSIGWITGLALLGDAVGSEWPKWRSHLDYVDYAALAILLAVLAYLIYRHVQRVRSGRDGRDGSASERPVDVIAD
jgi:membrane protein DedA with SNARE-associated domain